MGSDDTVGGYTHTVTGPFTSGPVTVLESRAGCSVWSSEALRQVKVTESGSCTGSKSRLTVGYGAVTLGEGILSSAS